MSKANHFAEHKPCVILYAIDEDNPQVLLNTETNMPIVFTKYTKARKFVANKIDPSLHPFIKYVNSAPELGAGDREETHNKKCLKCGSFLRIGANQASVLPDGTVMDMDILDCPKCHLGEE